MTEGLRRGDFSRRKLKRVSANMRGHALNIKEVKSKVAFEQRHIKKETKHGVI